MQSTLLILNINYGAGWWKFNLYRTGSDIPSLADLYGCTDESSINYNPSAIYPVDADCELSPPDSSWSAVGVWEVSNMEVGDGGETIWWSWDSISGAVSVFSFSLYSYITRNFTYITRICYEKN